MNKRHAFLIMLSGEPLGFLEHIKKYDDEDIDFYIHVDKNVQHSYLDEVNRLVFQKSNVKVMNEIAGKWGDFSLVKIEMLLFHTALQMDKYAYLHLVSGSDYFLKSPLEMKSFFENKYPSNFVNFERETDFDRKRPLAKLLSLKLPISSKKIKYAITSRELGLRLKFKNKGAHNINLDLKFRKGSQWVSLTTDAAKYIVDQYELIVEVFKDTLIPDELFVQTLLYSSPHYRKTITGNNLRYIDWQRGVPYVFSKADQEELDDVTSKWLIARKYNFNNE